jgi:predicted 3-demethylubiquinone-9 3-methyltransferase (glyoxalase superfamily)
MHKKQEKSCKKSPRFYVSIFKNSKVQGINRQGDKVFSVSFSLNGLEFAALNGGPMFKFSPATSFVVNCEDQAEVDYYWEKLGAGGKHNRCAWLNDKFGMSWQIVPKQLGQLLSDPDPVKAERVMRAMMQMNKIDIAKLQQAHDAA